jgi:energy-coupling factor transporter ATP-binding protein EcfA2
MPALQLSTFDREEFITRRWRYRPGEHVTAIGPTGSGKTVLVYQLLDHTAGRHMPAVVLVKKPRDTEVTARSKTMAYRTIRAWPPGPSIFKDNDPPGWVLWPRTDFANGVGYDRAKKSYQFRRAIMATYRGGGVFKRRPRILVVDDAFGLSEILDLREELIEMWTEARSMNAGLWAAFQKPTHVPLWAYSQAEHIFLFNDPDKRSRERFSEIGGVDPVTVRDTVFALGDHQALYIRRGGRRMCIVDA